MTHAEYTKWCDERNKEWSEMLRADRKFLAFQLIVGIWFCALSVWCESFAPMIVAFGHFTFCYWINKNIVSGSLRMVNLTRKWREEAIRAHKDPENADFYLSQ